MRLVDNWRRVLARAWSVRLIVLAALLSGIEGALPLTIEDQLMWAPSQSSMLL